MTLGRLMAGFLAFLLAAAALLIWAAEVRDKLYDQLIQKANTLIETLDKEEGIQLEKEEQLDEEIKSILADHPTVKVKVLTPAGRLAQQRYYREGALAALDRFATGERLLRRDLMDSEGRLRVQVFFGRKGEVSRLLFRDEEGNPVDVKLTQLPLPYAPYRYP